MAILIQKRSKLGVFVRSALGVRGGRVPRWWLMTRSVGHQNIYELDKNAGIIASGTIAIDYGPGSAELSLGSDGQRLWFSDARVGTISEISTQDYTVISTFAAPVIPAQRIGMTATNKFIYWACDKTTGPVTKLYKLNLDGGVVSVVDLPLDTSRVPFAAGVNASDLWVLSTDSRISRFDQVTLAYTASYGVSLASEGIADGTWIASGGDGPDNIFIIRFGTTAYNIYEFSTPDFSLVRVIPMDPLVVGSLRGLCGGK